jgi:acetyltransferase-like isoleucine patch superfamily enzyme
MKHLIKNKIRILIERIYPEITISKEIFNNNIYYEYLKNYIQNSNISIKTKIYPPFKIDSSIVGDYTYIAQNSIISNTTIGKFCSIGANVVCGWGIHPTNGISTHPMFYSTQKQNGITLSKNDKIEERKPIKIGNDVFVGVNVTILDGITIGDGAIIGAGAVVTKDIPPYAIAIGNPIEIIKYRFSREQIEKILKIRWWDFEYEKLQNLSDNFFDLNTIIKNSNI